MATGFLASDTINCQPRYLSCHEGSLCDFSKGHLLYSEQLKVIAFTLIPSVVGTAIIGFALKATLGLRPTPEQEEE